MTATISTDYKRLNGLLWRYRPVLERFEFLLELQLTVTASGRQDWQRHMSELFEEVADAVAALDLEREVLVPRGLPLGELAANAPDPWSAILAEQHSVMDATIGRIGELRVRNTQSMMEGSAGVAQAIETLLAQAGRATPDGDPTYGRPNGRAGGAVLFDGRI